MGFVELSEIFNTVGRGLFFGIVTVGIFIIVIRLGSIEKKLDKIIMKKQEKIPNKDEKKTAVTNNTRGIFSD